MTKPDALKVRPEGIPDALKAERRWVCWRYELRDGRWAKLPCTTRGYHAKSNDPSTWTTFDDAVAAYPRFDGIGFVLGDGWAGIDLDHCFVEGMINEAFIATIRRLDGHSVYSERSPSGTGYKAIGHSSRVGGQIDFATDPPSFTMWQGARFFTVTGHCENGVDHIQGIDEFLDEWFPAPSMSNATAHQPVPAYIRHGDTRGTENIVAPTDEDVVARILVSPQADKFIRLVRGDLSDYGNDHSRADQALASILAYWCSGDVDQIDRLFRQSKLMRPKWNTRSYRSATLAKAVAR